LLQLHPKDICAKENAMDYRRLRVTLGSILLLIFAVLSASAQDAASELEALKKSAPKVYLDCGECDIEYIKNEISFVNYVRDRKEAQVHILVTTQHTGSGGREYTLTFLGQNEFSGIDDLVRYFSKQSDTQDDIRKGLVRSLKQGLAGYAARTPIASRLIVRAEAESSSGDVRDRWDSWVFNIGGEGRFNGEESSLRNNFGFNLTANRITADWKLRIGVSSHFDKDSFTYDGEEIKSSQEKYGADGLLVKSLGDHWSAGLSFEAASSTYDNTRRRITLAPAVEFNLFPYAESTRRQLRFLYRLQWENVRYQEATIYDRTRESLWSESLSITLDLKEKWGSISTSLSGSHYFHDLKFNRLDLFGFIQLNLIKGLNAHVFGGGSRIHDQLGLVKGDASLEEILLRRRQLATTYNYFVMVGLSYTFGSIYTNVVNPRFGRAGGNGMTIRID
jgi:hypothetical protein